MARPVRRFHPTDPVELFIVGSVKKGDLVKPFAGEEARMRARKANKTDKGMLFVASHEGENDMVDCFDWFFFTPDDIEVPNSAVLVLADDGEFKIKSSATKSDRVVGETLEGGVLLSPNVPW